MEVLLEDISSTLKAEVTLPSLLDYCSNVKDTKDWRGEKTWKVAQERSAMRAEERSRLGLGISKEKLEQLAKEVGGGKVVQWAREMMREERGAHSPELPTSPPALVHEISELSLNEMGREDEGEMGGAPGKRGGQESGGRGKGGVAGKRGNKKGRGAETEEEKQSSAEVREIMRGGSRGKEKEGKVQFLFGTMQAPIRTGGAPRIAPKSVRFEESV
jgi:hypothetical protein